MKEKRLRGVFGFFLISLLITFLTLYLFEATGYYQYAAHKKVVYTSEQIKQFEKDLKEGKDVRMEDYLDGQNKDYGNKLSKFGYHISTSISHHVKNFLQATFQMIYEWIKE